MILPRFRQWFDLALGERAEARVPEAAQEFPSTFMADDKLQVSESTITEFSRTVAIYERRQQQPR